MCLLASHAVSWSGACLLMSALGTCSHSQWSLATEQQYLSVYLLKNSGGQLIVRVHPSMNMLMLNSVDDVCKTVHRTSKASQLAELLILWGRRHTAVSVTADHNISEMLGTSKPLSAKSVSTQTLALACLGGSSPQTSLCYGSWAWLQCPLMRAWRCWPAMCTKRSLSNTTKHNLQNTERPCRSWINIIVSTSRAANHYC